MNVERLTILAKHMDKIAATPVAKRKRKFRMNVFWEQTPCGTSACMGGEATTIPAFRKAGLQCSFEAPWSFGVPWFKGRAAFSALEAFFDLSGCAGIYLFGIHNPNSPKKAAQRIRKLIAGTAVLKYEATN